LPPDDDSFPTALPLLVAAEQGWTEVVAVLLANEVDAN
jgi:hypothetical protein